MCVHIELRSRKKEYIVMGYDIYEMLTGYMGLTKTVSCKLWKHKMYDRKNKHINVYSQGRTLESTYASSEHKSAFNYDYHKLFW